MFDLLISGMVRKQRQSGFNHDLHAQSAVFDGSTGYLDRSFASAHAAGRRALTISAVVKSGANGTVLASSPAGDNYVFAGIGTEGQVHFWDWRTGYQFRLTTSGQFASPLAHCHVVWVLDTDNATEADRARIYVNGVRITDFSTETYPAENFDANIMTADQHLVGQVDGGSWFNGNLSELAVVSGQALDPESFGHFDSKSGRWVVDKPAVSDWGQNGFYIQDFTTGTDMSGNGHDFTPTGGITSSLDSGSNNYATWNPLGDGANWSYGSGNLVATNSSTTASRTHSTLRLNDFGKVYFEWTASADGQSGVWYAIGIGPYDPATLAASGTNVYTVEWNQAANIKTRSPTDDTTVRATGVTAGEVFACAYDADAGSVWFGIKNGSVIDWYGGGDPAAGTSPTYSGVTGDMFAVCSHFNGGSMAATVNFGQAGFAVAAPSGFKAACTASLPAVEYQASDYIAQGTYNGSGAAQQINGLGFPPDLLILKSSTIASNWRIFDSARGFGSANKEMCFNTTGAEGSSQSCIVSVHDDGFAFADGGGTWEPNASGETYEFLALKAGPHFQAVKYTGDGVQGKAIAHPLGSKPALVIVKRVDSEPFSWRVGADAIGWTNYMRLNNGAGSQAADYFNDQEPTSTHVFVGSGGEINAVGGEYIMYVFANIPGLSDARLRDGAGAEDFAYKGGRPLASIHKRTTSTADWYSFFASTNPANPRTDQLSLNDSDALATVSTAEHDALVSGLHLVGTAGSMNAASHSYLDLCFMEGPVGGANIPPALAGAGLAAEVIASTVVYLMTETGDNLTTDSGDQLILE